MSVETPVRLNEEYIDRYSDICNKFSVTLQATLENGDNYRSFALANCFYSDMNEALKMIDNRYEIDIYREALLNYRSALLFLSIGMYKHAYTSLRSYFELFLFGIKLSVNELDFRMWKSNKKDLYWSEIIHEDNGVFSHNFFEVFCKDLKDYRKEYASLAMHCYRECSEFIHNNYSTFQRNNIIELSQSEFENLSNKISNMNKVICFIYFVRYFDVIKNDINTDIEEFINDKIGTHPEVIAMLKGDNAI